MEKEQIQDFTRRLSQCNKGEMIVIIYDIYFVREEEAKTAWEQKDFPAFKTAIHNAQETLNELIGALDFSYPIAGNLYMLYTYARDSLSKSLYSFNLEGIQEAEKVLRRLYDSFVAVAEQDTSEPLMRNTQQVYTGMTYGKSKLNVDYMEMDQDRGFTV